MYLIDTNTYAFILRDEHGVGDVVRKKDPYLDVSYISTIVVAEVLFDGRLKYLEQLTTGKARHGGTIGLISEGIKKDIEGLNEFNICAYTDDAEKIFNSIYNKKENGPSKEDWRLAAHAITLDMVLVTDNISDFERIKQYAPKLKYENWANRST